MTEAEIKTFAQAHARSLAAPIVKLVAQVIEKGMAGIIEQAVIEVQAAQPAAQEPSDAYDMVEAQIVSRYRVEKTRSGFWPSCVVADGGTGELFVGRTSQCEQVAAALQTACLDGAFMASKAAAQPAAQEPDMDPNDATRRRESLHDQAIWDLGYAAAVEEMERAQPAAQEPSTVRDALAAMILEHDAGGITLATMREARIALEAQPAAQEPKP